MNTSVFGGTGKQLDPDSGFGGTGKSSSGFGGTGIIGTITKFGSVWINGIEIGYGNKTHISSNLKKQDRLKLGQQVLLLTDPRNDKTITRQIEIFYPIAGKVTELSSDEVVVSGKYKVQINKETLVDRDLKLSKNQYVAVSGYQIAGKQWVATRLNTNDQQKTLYQPIPQFSNEGKVNRWIIEAGSGQIKNYEEQLQLGTDMLNNAGSAHHLVIEVVNNSQGRAEIKSMMPYPEHIKMQDKEHYKSEQGQLGDKEGRQSETQHRLNASGEKDGIDARDAMEMHQDGSQQNREQLIEHREQIEMQHEQQNAVHAQQEQKEMFKEMQQQQREAQQQQREMQQQQQEIQQEMETIRQLSNPERD
ncbi:DUF5666 domain-containing protein [Hydrogenovibrio marinus]|nr:DUF5666 domain-containing protein [Hydrogenovibrio marinus]